jgi:acetolactate synthase-1/2/3 large subunit
VSAGYHTTSPAFLEALAEAGVRYIFASPGGAHPGLNEALAQVNAEGRAAAFPRLIVCPHETVALSAAHAYASVSRQPQAVFVHAGAGTQNLGGPTSNVLRARVPVLVFADAGLRGCGKYNYELRTGRHVKQVVHRALQIARSEPAGPVYLVGPREVMEEPAEPCAADPADYPPVGPAALTDETTRDIATALAGARHPLIVTSYLGRNPDAVPALVQLAELLAIPVLESAAFCVNFPGDHPLHAGYQFTTAGPNQFLAEADVILVLDSDVPPIHATSRPSPDAAIYTVDIDPLKASMSMWHVPARRVAAADTKVAVEQITRFVRDNVLFAAGEVETRRMVISAAHAARRAALESLEQPEAGVITPGYLTACVRELLAGTDALVLTEAITSYQMVAEHLRVSRPGSLLGSGGSSPGWTGGGAVGAKLAAPERTVVCLVGDGSFLSGVPSSAQWVARRYDTPALTVIYDDRLEPGADLPGVAQAAGGAYGATVSDPGELPGVLKDALAVVHGGRSAVISVQLPSV